MATNCSWSSDQSTLLTDSFLAELADRCAIPPARQPAPKEFAPSSSEERAADVTAADYQAGFTRSTTPRVSSGPSR
jgi:hypothetical protein